MQSSTNELTKLKAKYANLCFELGDLTHRIRTAEIDAENLHKKLEVIRSEIREAEAHEQTEDQASGAV